MEAESLSWMRHWYRLPGMQRALSLEAQAGKLPHMVGLETSAKALTAWTRAGLSVLIAGPPGAGRTARVLALAQAAPPDTLSLWQVSVGVMRALSPEHLGLRRLERACRAGLSAGQRLAVYLPDGLQQLPQHPETVLAILELLAGLNVPVILEGGFQEQQTLLSKRPGWRQQGQVLRVEALSRDATRALLHALRAQAQEAGDEVPTALCGSEAGIELLVDLAARTGFWGALPGGALRLARALEASLAAPGEPRATAFLEDAQVIQALSQETQASAGFLTRGKLRMPSLSAPFSSSRPTQRLLSEGKPALLVQKPLLEQLQTLLAQGAHRQTDETGVQLAVLLLGPSGHGQEALVEELHSVLVQRVQRVRLRGLEPAASGEALLRPIGLEMRAAPVGILWIEDLDLAPQPLLEALHHWLESGRWPGDPEPVVAHGWSLVASMRCGAEALIPLAFGPQAPSTLDAMDARVIEEADQALPGAFRELWHGRLIFRPLLEAERLRLAQEQLERLAFHPSFRDVQVGLEVQPGVVDALAAFGYDPRKGAQGLERILLEQVFPLIQERVETKRKQAEPQSMRTLVLDLVRQRGELRVRERTSGQQPQPMAPALISFRSPTAPHSPDPFSLIVRGEQLLRGAGPRLRRWHASCLELEQRVQALRVPSAWLEQSPPVGLEPYRQLLLRVRAEERLQVPLKTLEGLLKQERGSLSATELEHALQEAERAIRAWAIFDAEEADCTVWMVLQPQDSSTATSRWLLEVAELELAWCARQGFHARPVACERIHDTLSRLILKAQGPGAVVALEMEEGRHQRVRSGTSSTVQLELILASPAPEEPRPGLKLLPITPGPLGLELTCRGRLELKGRQQFCDLEARSPLELSHVLQDLEQAWSTPLEKLPLARVYADDALGGVDDPRTNARGIRLSEVLAGELRALSQAWKARVEKG